MNAVGMGCGVLKDKNGAGSQLLAWITLAILAVRIF